MAQQDILERAKQGDPQVLEALINRSTQSKGILARVRKRETCLHILLESAQILNQEATIKLIQGYLQNVLAVEAIDSLHLYNRQTGQKTTLWEKKIFLHPNGHSEAHPETPPNLSTTDPVDQWADSSDDHSDEISDYWAEPSPEPSIQSAVLTEPALETKPSQPETDVQSAEVAIAPTPTKLQNDPETLNLSSGSIQSDSTMAEDRAIAPNEWTTLPVSSSNPPPESILEPVSINTQPDSSQSPSDAALPPEHGTDRLFDDEAPTTDLPDLLKRPEAAILIIFALMVALWDIYVDLIEDPDADRPLTQRELGRRLGIHSSTISRRKDREDFSLWTQDLDPEGIAWMPQGEGFVPVEIGNPE